MQYLIDASVYVFRAYYSMPDDMVDDAGNPINALYGFCRFIGDFMEQVTPEYVAIAFDESLTSSFRTEIYPEYKANRDPAPPELKRQFEQCRRYVRALGVMELGSPRYEADDLIGTLLEHGRRHGRPSTIVSRDKDLTQLLGKDDVFWDFAGKGKLGYDEIPASFGVCPEQIAEFLVVRYGEFALYRPRTTGKTLVLWLAPFLLVVVGGFALMRVVKHRMSLPIDDESGEAG